jgi:predicted CopG family antitoxin
MIIYHTILKQNRRHIMRQRITISISQEAYLNLKKLMDEVHELNTSRFIDTLLKSSKKKEEGETDVKSNESERI